jgi:hypothetical protein
MRQTGKGCGRSRQDQAHKDGGIPLDCLRENEGCFLYV